MYYIESRQPPAGLFFPCSIWYNCFILFDYSKFLTWKEVFLMNEHLERTALVLEGGGMRGLFTAGVLDFFLEQKLHFDDCLAVSAGACHACSFLSGQ